MKGNSENYIEIKDVKNPSDAIFQIGDYLSTGEYSNKKLKLNLKNLAFEDLHLESIKKLADTVDSQIAAIYTDNSQTEMAAINSGLIVLDIETL